mgnify:CR=1 FL=1
MKAQTRERQREFQSLIPKPSGVPGLDISSLPSTGLRGLIRRMSFTATDLETLPAALWRDWERAVETESHPFRTPVLGTTNLFECAMRVVVLRRADAAKRQLVAYSDARA